MEGEASFRLLRPKEVFRSTKIFNEKVLPKKVTKIFHLSSQKRLTDIALGIGISPEKQNFHLKFG